MRGRARAAGQVDAARDRGDRARPAHLARHGREQGDARTGFEGEPNAAVVEVASVLFNDLVERKGLSIEEARKSMARTEPFQKYPALVAKLGSKK